MSTVKCQISIQLGNQFVCIMHFCVRHCNYNSHCCLHGRHKMAPYCQVQYRFTSAPLMQQLSCHHYCYR